MSDTLHKYVYLCSDCNHKMVYTDTPKSPRCCSNCGSKNIFKKGGEVRPRSLHQFLDGKVNHVI